MRNNETGEFELVVGNRQLLSGFFIVVLLFAVAFAMGYVVGENSRTAKAGSDIAGAAPTSAVPADPRPTPSQVASSRPPVPDSPQSAEPLPPAANPTPQPTTRPSPDVPLPSHTEPLPSEPPKREVPKRETPPKSAQAPPPTREKTPPAPVAAPAVQPTQGPPGSYWQVLATANRESAQDMVKSLQDKGLPASLSPGPNNLMRVVVGPYRDTQALGKAKTELEGAGLHPVRR